MSLIKQLWLAIAVLMTLVFGGAFAVSTWSAKRYLEEQLYLKNVDNATSLALSMSQMPKDLVTLELQLAAQFDTGHYRAIRLADPGGKVLLGRESDVAVEQVPQWFMDALPLTAAPGVAQVQDGWNQFGTLTVESHSRYAYVELWRGSLRLLGWFLLAALAGGVVGSLLLKMILRPLREVVTQAEAIGGRRFVTTAEPATTEFRSVVRAMNALSDRVRNMVAEESRRVDELRRQVQHDPLTGLLNRDSFMNTLGAVLADPDAHAAGSLVMLRVADLAGLNRSLGREAADQLLKRVADSLQQVAGQSTGWVAGRLNGADFALLAGGATDVAAVAGRVAAAARLVAERPDGAAGQALAVAATPLVPGEAQSHLLARVDRALAQAEQSGEVVTDLDVAARDGEPTDLAGWRTALEAALQPGSLRLGRFPVVARGGALLHDEAPVRLKLGDAWLPAGRFVAWVARLGWMTRLDLHVVDAALAAIAAEGRPLGINLSAESVCDAGFVEALTERLRRAPEAASRLWIEVPEHGALHDVAGFRAFCLALKPFGCRVGLEHAGPQFVRIGELHDVGLDYIKVDAAFIRDIDANTGNQIFLRGVCMLAHAIGLHVIAEGVQSAAERACLPDLGIDGMTGPAIGG